MANSLLLKLLLPVALTCLLSALGNTLWKIQFVRTPLNMDNLSSNLHLAASPLIWGGIILFTLSMALFFILLSKHNLSIIVPVVTALTYIFNYLSAILIFKEKISLIQISGACLIIVGIYLISKVEI